MGELKRSSRALREAEQKIAAGLALDTTGPIANLPSGLVVRFDSIKFIRVGETSALFRVVLCWHGEEVVEMEQVAVNDGWIYELRGIQGSMGVTLK